MCRSFLSLILVACVFMALPLPAADDVEGSKDYPGWARIPGFEITDYDEDNPAGFTFSISRPTPSDPNHLEGMPVQGHRYVIQYEWGNSGRPPSPTKSQRHYERLADAGGYKVEKSGAVGNATETFHLMKDGKETWIFYSPSGKNYTLTVVETKAEVLLPVTAPAPTPVPVPSVASTNVVTPQPPASASSTALPPTLQSPLTPSTSIAPTGAAEDPLATELLKNGRVVLPLTFQPGKPALEADSKPVINRVIAILKQHPDMALTIAGHTDQTGDEQYNITLSRQRAQQVRSLLIAGHISSKRLTASGFGGSQPIADEATAEGREKNRRIELVIKKGKGDTSGKGKVFTPGDSVGNDPNDFHAPAPDGVNYYPDPNKIVAPPPPPGVKSN